MRRRDRLALVDAQDDQVALCDCGEDGWLGVALDDGDLAFAGGVREAADQGALAAAAVDEAQTLARDAVVPDERLEDRAGGGGAADDEDLATCERLGQAVGEARE